MYRAVKYFTDLHDKDYPYNVGDLFPREGVKVTEERLVELSGSENKRGEPLIERVEEVPEEKTPVKKAPVKKAATRKTPAKK